MTVQTVLFDLDGTLLDSNELIRKSHLYTLNHYYPGKYTEADVVAFNGPSLNETYSRFDTERYPEMVATYREFNQAKHDELVRLFPDVEATLARLKKAGLKLAVVSTKFRKTVDRGLNIFGLQKYFDLVIGGDDCQHEKPNPEPLLFAMEELASPKETTIMVGDNWQDLEAANRAGVPGIFVAWSEKSAKDMAKYKPYYIPNNMIELGDWILAKETGGNHS